MDMMFQLITINDEGCTTRYFANQVDVIASLEYALKRYANLKSVPEEADFPEFGISKDRARAWCGDTRWFVEDIAVGTLDYEDEVSTQRGNVRVTITNIGEGLCGDFNDEDPDDVNLLRFYVDMQDEETGEWTEVEDASYCTRITADTPKELLLQACHRIMDEVYKPLQDGNSIKTLCECLSWITV